MCYKAIIALVFSIYSSLSLASSSQMIECTSYYHISAKTLKAMNMPQMKNVTERLASSETKLRSELANGEDKDWQSRLDAEIKKQQAQVDQAGNLSPLMQKYKTACKTLVDQL